MRYTVNDCSGDAASDTGHEFHAAPNAQGLERREHPKPRRIRLCEVIEAASLEAFKQASPVSFLYTVYSARLAAERQCSNSPLSFHATTQATDD